MGVRLALSRPRSGAATGLRSCDYGGLHLAAAVALAVAHEGGRVFCRIGQHEAVYGV